MTEEGESDDAIEGDDSEAWRSDGSLEFEGVDVEVTRDGTSRFSAASENDETDGEDASDAGDDGGLDIPLPWNTVSREDSSDEANGGDADSDADGDRGGNADSTAEGAEEPRDPDRFEDLRFVGPKSAASLRESPVSLSDLVEKRVAYRDLTAAGVHPGVAAKIRREHSLSWSLDGGGTDLDRRSAQVRGLDDDERAWIAASSGWSEDEAATETDGSGDAANAEAAWRSQTTEEEPRTASTDGADGSTATPWADERSDSEAGSTSETSPADELSSTDAEAAWRQQSAPTPVTAIEGLDEDIAAALRRAGIGSVRRLATADPESVADALEIDTERVESWRKLARERESQ